MKCCRSGSDKYGLTHSCIRELGHEGKCLCTGDVSDIVFRFKTEFHYDAVFDEKQIESICSSLNEDSEGYRYSQEQVRAALWKFFEEEAGNLIEDLEEKFFDLKLSSRERLLGEPEIDIKEEQRLEAGDVSFDAARDKWLEEQEK
jgi:hypothetical protein